MQRIFSIISVLLFCLVLTACSLPSKVLAADNTPAPKVIITEIKLGDGENVIFDDGTQAKDFVTIYNQSELPISLEDWTLQYAKSELNYTTCDEQSSNTSVTDLSPYGTLLPGTASLPIKRSLTDGADGSLWLVDNLGLVNDLVGWGDSTRCYEEKAALTPPDGSGSSLQRFIDCDNQIPVDTNNNSVDFTLSETPGPGTLTGPLTSECTDNSANGDNTGGNDQTGDNNSNNGDNTDTGGYGGGPQSSCNGVIISELLPNPAGSDTDHEFIELHNPTGSSISLSDCQLQTTANTKTYKFLDLTLSPNQYKAFYNGETGLTLANTSGGSVYLIDTDNTELDQADYAANLDDDVSWSLIDGDWTRTFSVTPDKANELLTTQPCPMGQFRNPDTNRCNNIAEEASALLPCAPGKERNPETHRCRNIISLASVLAACSPGHYRNPATNRCKKYSASVGTLKPCKADQERNPDTNRCRKISAISSSTGGINDVKDVLSASTQAGGSNWSFAVFSIIGAFSYGLWEWRNEIIQKLSLLKAKFS